MKAITTDEFKALDLAQRIMGIARVSRETKPEVRTMKCDRTDWIHDETNKTGKELVKFLADNPDVTLTLSFKQ